LKILEISTNSRAEKIAETIKKILKEHFRQRKRYSQVLKQKRRAGKIRRRMTKLAKVKKKSIHLVSIARRHLIHIGDVGGDLKWCPDPVIKRVMWRRCAKESNMEHRLLKSLRTRRSSICL